MTLEFRGGTPGEKSMPLLSVTAITDLESAIDVASQGGALETWRRGGGRDPASRLEIKFEGICSTCFELLQQLTKDAWDAALIESAITALLSKLYGCNDEAVAKGQQVIIDQVNVWTTWVQRAKDLMRACRKLSKGSFKNEKVSTLLTIEPMPKFLIDCKLQPAPTPTMLLCSTVFESDVAKANGIRLISGPFSKAMDLGRQAFSAHGAGATISAAKQVSPDP